MVNSMVKYHSRLDATFRALADPTRRAILAALTSGQTSVSVLAAPYRMSLPAVMKHLQVLERAGLVALPPAASLIATAASVRPANVKLLRSVCNVCAGIALGEDAFSKWVSLADTPSTSSSNTSSPSEGFRWLPSVPCQLCELSAADKSAAAA